MKRTLQVNADKTRNVYKSPFADGRENGEGKYNSEGYDQTLYQLPTK
jgi:hypothetical protein